MELLFIILSLGCQIILLSHASDYHMGSQVLVVLLGISFSGRGLMILSVIFLALAAFFGVLHITDGASTKKELGDLKAENAMLKTSLAKKEAALEKERTQTPQV